MRIESFKGVLLSTLLMASIMALAIPLFSPIPVHAALTSHAPIYINGNAGFTSPDPVNGGGSGTAGDPYIIENWDISAGSANGIEVSNTTAYFIIRNCYVHDGGEYGDGIIYFYNVTNGVLDNVLVENGYYQGILLISSSNNRISNSTVENTQVECGIFLNNSDNNIIENNTCRNNKIVGIYLQYYSDNNLIRNNIAENNNTGISLEPYLYNNLIENNLATNNIWHGISVVNSSNNTISNNTCKNNGYQGIDTYISDNNLISNNIAENNSQFGILLSYSLNNTVSNNIAGNSQVYDGIFLWNSDNNTLSSNTCSNNPYHGIFLDNSSDNNLVSNNLMEGNDWDGILLYLSGGNTIDNNIAKGNSMSGIFLNRSGNNLISNNILKNNIQEGIQLYYSCTNNLISNNLAVRNGTGTRIRNYSDNNRIFHNNFINNGSQAYDECSNSWDNGYPSGGNYWSDYTGVDENHGENQDISGSDGIGDTPYYKDRYPIMSPFPFRDVGIEISPIYRDGPAKATMTFIVTVTNLGTENDNYDLTVSENAGWGPTLLTYLLEVPAGENGQTTLSVTIPENATPCTEDGIIVVATSKGDNRVKDTGTCVAHAISPKAELSLVTLYKVGLDLNLYLENGSKLVVKFYGYDNIYQAENVIWSGTTPAHVVKSENVAHPSGIGVKKAKLWLVDSENNEISKIKGWETIRSDLWGRLGGIRLQWPYATPAERSALWAELGDIRLQWPYTPTTRDPGWVDP